jgi:hypothetical protein
MNPTTVRRFRAAPFGLALLCFFLPFVQFSCTMQRNIGFPVTGIQLVTGTEIQNPQFDGPFGGPGGKSEKVPASGMAILAFLCTLGALGVCFVSLRQGTLLAAVLGGLGFVFLLLLKAHLDQEAVKQGQGMMVVDYKFGFILTCLCLLAGVGMHVYLLRTRASTAAPPAL